MQIFDPSISRYIPVEQMVLRNPEERARALVRHIEINICHNPTGEQIRQFEDLAQALIEGPESLDDLKNYATARING